jgi:hypothetical protein
MNEIQAEIARLRAARADAHKRGFATLTCKANLKDPDPRYSPHAVNSATKDSATAMLPYDNGIPANFGIGLSDNLSNLAVIDCDHGCKSFEEFIAWRDRNHFPATLTVHTGNRDGWRFHMYYAGAIKQTSFAIDGFSGEVKSQGGYVCGAGVRHESGALYEYVLDVPIAATPEFIRAFAKTAYKPAHINKDEEFPETPAGQRDAKIFSVGGSLRNLGMSEAAIAFGMDDYCRHHAEDGESYADEFESKIRDKAYRLFNKYDVAAQREIIFLQKATTGLGMSKVLAANALRDAKGEKL